MIKDIGFKIKPTVEAKPAQKELAATRKSIKGIGSEMGVFKKTSLETMKGLTTQFKDWRKSLKDGAQEFRQWSTTGIDSVNRVTGALGKMKSSIFNIRNAIAGTIVGAVALKSVSAIYNEGKQTIGVRNRLNREFGEGADFIRSTANIQARRSGMTEVEAARGLIPFAEQLDAIQAGSSFRGMKGRLSASQALALRQKNLGVGAEMLGRLKLLAPDVDPNDIGHVLADALSGPEGIRSLISTFNLSKRSRTLSTANEQGQAFKMLTPEERKQFGVSRRGQYLEQGDLVNLVLQRSGLTADAATAQMGKLSTQFDMIKSKFSDTLGDIGQRALDKFNLKLGNGATIAERFQQYLDSKDGKELIDGIASAFSWLAETTATVAKELPKIGSFLSEHKSTLLALGTAYMGLKAVSFAGGGARSGGAVGALGNALGGALPVNMVGASPGVLGSLRSAMGAAGGVLASAGIGTAIGMELGDYLQKNHGDWIDKNLLGDWAGINRGEQILKDADPIIAAAKRHRDEVRKAKGLAPLPGSTYDLNAAAERRADRALKNSPLLETPINGSPLANGNSEIHVTANLILDGKVAAKVLIPHIVHEVKRASANGAAPVHQER